MTEVKRARIDWEAIERDYRIGQLSIRELARRHDIEPSTITRKAKKENWARDYSDEVRARTKAGLVQGMLDAAALQAQQDAHDQATQTHTALQSGIEIAVETNLRVLRDHQATIRTNSERLKTLTVKFDALADEIADIKEIATAAAAFESIVRSQKNLVAMEREVLNIDDKDGGKERGLTDLATDELKRLRARLLSDG